MRVGDLAHEHGPRAVGGGEVGRAAAGKERGRLLDSRADERVGVLRPGDGDLDLLEGVERRAARSRARARASSRCTPPPSGPSARRGRGWARAGSSPRARRARSVGLKPTMPQQAAGIRIDPPVSEPSAASARFAASAAAEPPLDPPGHAPGRERVRDVPVVLVLGGRPVGELVQVRLADVRVAGRLEPLHGLGRLGRDVLGEDRRAVGRRQAGGVEEVLDRERDPLGRARSGRARKMPGSAPVSETEGLGSVDREVDEGDRDRPGRDQAEEDEEAPAPEHVLALGLRVRAPDHRRPRPPPTKISAR